MMPQARAGSFELHRGGWAMGGKREGEAEAEGEGTHRYVAGKVARPV